MMKETKTAFVKSIVSSGLLRTNRIAKVIKDNTDKSPIQSRIDAEKQILEALAERIYYLEVRLEDALGDALKPITKLRSELKDNRPGAIIEERK